MEEEDIKIIEEFIEHIKFVEERTLYELEAKERCKKRYKALESLLKAYKQDEEVIDEMAYVMSKTIRISGVRQHKKFFKEYFRKKVGEIK